MELNQLVYIQNPLEMERHLYAEERGAAFCSTLYSGILCYTLDALGGSVTAVNQRNWR